jgi:hypothetical protein
LKIPKIITENKKKNRKEIRNKENKIRKKKIKRKQKNKKEKRLLGLGPSGECDRFLCAAPPAAISGE